MAYHPGVIDQDITLFRAGEALPAVLQPMHAAAGSMHTDPMNGWGAHTSGRVDVVDVPGDHLVLMEEPQVADVAARLSEALCGRWDRREAA
jgi:thioesterase domain-containing protein